MAGNARRTRIGGVRGHVWAPQTKVRRSDWLARYVARRSRAPYLRRWALLIALGELIHLVQEVLIGLGELELVEQELHRLDGVELGQRLPKQPDLLQLVLLEEELFLAGAGLLDIDRGEDALVHEAPVEVHLHVTGALELLEDHVVHPRARVDEGGGHDGERAALLDVPRRGKEAARALEGIGVEAAR